MLTLAFVLWAAAAAAVAAAPASDLSRQERATMADFCVLTAVRAFLLAPRVRSETGRGWNERGWVWQLGKKVGLDLGVETAALCGPLGIGDMLASALLFGQRMAKDLPTGYVARALKPAPAALACVTAHYVPSPSPSPSPSAACPSSPLHFEATGGSEGCDGVGLVSLLEAGTFVGWRTASETPAFSMRY